MIQEILQFLTKEMNQFFRLKYGLREDLAVLCNLMNQDESILKDQLNKILVTLIHLEEDRVHRDHGSYVKTDDQFSRSKPAVKLNMQVLYAANFAPGNYAEGLNYMTGVVGFYQAHNVFLAQQYPDLKTRQEKLGVELVNLTLHEQNNLWATLGARYMPSILYRMKTVYVQEPVLLSKGSLIKTF